MESRTQDSRPRPRTQKKSKAKDQRWSPRGHILKSLALASKVKSLASRPQVLENWPVLGSRTALSFGKLKFCGAVEKVFGKRFVVEIAWKIFVKTFFFFLRSPEKFLWRPFFFFFGEHLRFVSLVLGLGLEHSCPWPRECLSSERLSFALASDFFCVLGLGLEPCVLDSTSAKDSLSEDRPSRGQGQKCLRPSPRTKDTAASVLQKKKFSKNFFRWSPIHRHTQNFWLREA